MLAQHIAHYKQTKLARDKAWAIKAVQSKVMFFHPLVHVKMLHPIVTIKNFSFACPWQKTPHEKTTQVCRPSMRRVAASITRGGDGGCDMFGGGGGGGGSVASESNGFSTGTGAVGNTLLMGDGNGCGNGSGVSSITFDQHSAIVRYPNSMSNLRRLRCYLLACQVGLLVACKAGIPTHLTGIPDWKNMKISDWQKYG